MTHISREYAEALFALAQESGRPAEFETALDLTEETLKENPDFLKLLSSPAVSREDRTNALSSVLGGKIPLSVEMLLRMMVHRGHAKEIREMIVCYRELDRDSRRESVAKVVSAAALTEEQQSALAEKLEKRFGRKMILDCQVDPSLIGGIRVEAEGTVLDGTLRSRLREIKDVMNSGAPRPERSAALSNSRFSSSRTGSR